MMFFFYFEPNQFQSGQVCEIVSVHHPAFEKNIGQRIVITKVITESRMVWAYEARRPKYRQNRNGRWVTEFNPRCVESIYSFDQLCPLPEHEAKELLGTLQEQPQ